MYAATFRPYHRYFCPPLQTHHGEWRVREGIIVRLASSQENQGRIGWGEIAPIPWFGSESFTQAWAYCQQLPPNLPPIPELEIPAQLPACQFGLVSAWLDLTGPETVLPPEAVRVASPQENRPASLCGLLPTGAAALIHWPHLYNQGYRTLKWKIGVAPIAQELDCFQALLSDLPPTVTLRLDANGGLSVSEATAWLQACDRYPGRIEFLEQPLPPAQLAAMLTLNQQFATPLALDESVATLDQLDRCYHQGWRGIYVLKPAIAGSPQRLQQRCQDYGLDIVVSSVFETAIARQAALRLAYQHSPTPRVPGFGTQHWFGDDPLQAAHPAQLWQALAESPCPTGNPTAD